VRAVLGDITQIPVDMMVNAANASLLGGGGVDGAIHDAAGIELLLECETLGGCEVGQAKLTKGYALPCKWVAHTVGPRWQGGGANEEALLASCYRSCLELAREAEATSISFPAISTGVYRFPAQRAAEIAVRAVEAWLAANNYSIEVVFVVFDEDMLERYLGALEMTAMAA